MGYVLTASTTTFGTLYFYLFTCPDVTNAATAARNDKPQSEERIRILDIFIHNSSCNDTQFAHGLRRCAIYKPAFTIHCTRIFL